MGPTTPVFHPHSSISRIGRRRGTALNQDVIVANMNRELAGIQEAQALVIIPPPIRGLGQTGGFQMMVEDRGNLGLKELYQATTDSYRREIHSLRCKIWQRHSA